MSSGRIWMGWLLAAAACSAGPQPERAGGGASPVAASASASPVMVPAEWQLDYHLEGGIAGFDVSFRAGSDGQARYRRNRPESREQAGRLSPAEIEALGRLVVESGFLDLTGPYEPRAAVSDAFRYTLRWQAGGQVHEVSASDGVELPGAFVRVREAVAALERKVLAQAGPGEDQAGGEGK